jgi:hypothetical protein
MRLQFLLLLAAILPAHADWRRFLVEEPRTDPAPPRTLSYFSHDAFLRPESCVNCTAEQVGENAASAQAEVVKIGEVQGIGVFDVTYLIQRKPAGKSIIVKTGPDEYREIFYAEDFSEGGGRFYPTQIVSAGENEALVWLRVDYGGNRHPIEDFLIHFDSNGSTRVDLDPLLKAANSILPVNGDLFIWDMELLARENRFTLRSPVHGSCPKGAGLPCNFDEVGGTVEVDFRIEGGRTVPLGKRYIP